MTTEERAALRREVLRLAWPVMLQNLFRTVMFFVDTAMIAALRENGTDSVAAMSIVGPVMYALLLVLNSVGVGALATTARAFGARDDARTRQEAATGLAVALLLGAGIALAGRFGLPAAAQCFAPTDDPARAARVGALGASYLGYVSWALPFMLLDMTSASLLRAMGNTRTPMLTALVGNALNVVGNYALIYGHWGAPAMGVAGAGLSTAIGFSVQGTLTTAALFAPTCPVRLRLRDLRAVDRACVARLARVSTPAAIEPILQQSGFLVFTKWIAMLGAVPMAAHRATVTVESISFMPGFGVGVACSAIVGQMLGAARADRAEAGIRASAWLGAGMMGLLGVMFLAIPGVLLWPFVPRGDAETMAQAVTALRIGSIEQPLMGLTFVLAGALRGAGDTRSPVLVAAVGTWGVRVPAAYLLGHVLGFGLAGVWLTTFLDWGTRAAICWVIVRRGRWKSVNL